VVSEEEISTDPDKIKTVQDWPRPKTPKQMRGFIGLCSYYRKYVNKMGATSGAETANSSRAPEYTPGCLLPVVTLTCSRVVAHSGSLFSSVYHNYELGDKPLI
jgi:hypothetical protein